MSNFIIVIHGWHVSSNGFTVHEIKAGSLEEAEKEGALLCYKRETTFDKCAYRVIEIGDKQIVKPRRLSMAERITGRLGGKRG